MMGCLERRETAFARRYISHFHVRFALTFLPPSSDLQEKPFVTLQLSSMFDSLSKLQ